MAAELYIKLVVKHFGVLEEDLQQYVIVSQKD